MTRFQQLTLLTLLGTFLLLVMGAVVRATDSGLGCPDWPRCHGQWIPPADHHAWIEWTHRLVASVVGFLVLGMAAGAVVAYRRVKTILWPALANVALVGAQALLGREAVERELPAAVVMAHLAMALAILATLVYIAVSAFEQRRPLVKPAGPASRTVLPDYGFAVFAALGAAAVFVVLMTGAYVTGRDAGLVFTDWPLMNGQLIPDRGPLTDVHFTHRLVAAVVGVVLGAVAVQAWRWQRRQPVVVATAAAAFALYLAQVMLGAGQVWTKLSDPYVVLHVAVSSLIWCLMVFLVLASAYQARREALAETETPPGRRAIRDTVTAYFQLTKPRIIELLLITTVPTMVIAFRGWPPLWLVLATVIGGAMAAGSANAINCYLDRDIDRIMARTRGRPLPSGELEPERALEFGIVLGIVAFTFLTIVVNLVSALLAVGAIFFYVFVYTLWLKRSTDQNIVIGGAAGAVPPLVGWAAVSGEVGLPAVVLFAIIFMWTPPHFWALALKYANDYRAAGVPMLPVVRGGDETRRQILLYTALTVALTLALYPVAGMGPIYLAAALGLGGAFLVEAFRVWRRPSDRAAISLFRFSITYLGLLFAAMVVDQLVAAYAL